MIFFSVGDSGLDVSSGFAYCTLAPYVGMCMGGAGVAVCLGLDGQNVPGLINVFWHGQVYFMLLVVPS